MQLWLVSVQRQFSSFCQFIQIKIITKGSQYLVWGRRAACFCIIDLVNFIWLYKCSSVYLSFYDNAMSKNDFFSEPKWPSLDIQTYLDENIPQIEQQISVICDQSIIKEDVTQRQDLQMIFQAEKTYEQNLKVIQKLIDIQENNDTRVLRQPSDVIKQSVLQDQNMDQIDHQNNNQSKDQQNFSGEFSANSSYEVQKIKNNSKKFKKKKWVKYNILDTKAKKYLVQKINNNIFTITQLSKMYGISVNNLCRWKKSCDRKLGAGRKVYNLQLQKKMIQWIQFHLNNTQGMFLSRKIVQQKARQLSNNPTFKASKGWLQRFAKRNRDLHLIELFDMKLKIQTNQDLKAEDNGFQNIFVMLKQVQQQIYEQTNPTK